MSQAQLKIARTLQQILSRRKRELGSIRASSGHASSAGETKPPHHPPHPEPVNESLGRGFYITIAAIPLSLVLYKFSVSSDDSTAQPAFTRLINYYSNWNERWAQRNALHTRMSEQAAHDRNLFQSAPASQHIDLRFPEIFNTGSPYNVPAGHSANLDELIAHYHRQNAEANKAREARTRAAENGRKEQ
ncbi:hypothetical protein MMC22_007312 [Lobaria immixta]|nr:hypothetical protein [Lobaria immixta]